MLGHTKQEDAGSRSVRNDSTGLQQPVRDYDHRPASHDDVAEGENGTTENLATGLADKCDKQQMERSRQVMNRKDPGSSPRTFPAPQLATNTDLSAFSGTEIDFEAEMKLDEEAQTLDEAVAGEDMELLNTDCVSGDAMGRKRKREVEEMPEKNRPSAKQKMSDY